MIGIQLKGWLGNQMFQYAAAWTLADQLKCSLIIAGNSHGRRYGILGHWLGFDDPRLDPKVPQLGLQQNGVLHAAFGCGFSFETARLVELALPFLRRRLLSRDYSPKRVTLQSGEHAWEEFDPAFFIQPCRTWLDGWFQSEKYFSRNADRVRQWYRPKKEDELRIQQIIRGWPAPPERSVGIHVRRGDYANVRDNVADKEQGWLLPTRYYREALALIPKDAGLIIVSDDPDWVAETFADHKPWVSRGNTPVIDMTLMSRCRWNVIANSSFSWWAAWLNSHHNKVVIAPRYHLGWRIGRWVPGGIDVAGWTYIDVEP